MADPIRAALERLVAVSRYPGQATALEYQQARDAALAVLAAHPATTPSLAELVNPQPGYQPGTGREDGAQLVGSANGSDWWAPESGCDSLDATLDAIRSRIAPYLREPVAGVDVPGPDGDYGDVLDLCAAEGVNPQVGVPLLQRARKAWEVGATPTQPVDGVGEIRPEVRAAFTELERRQENLRNFRQLRADLATATSTPLADPDALAARPLLEAVARMGDCIGQHTVGQVMALSDRATSWLSDNPPGQPVAIEPRGCPAPGACSCVQPVAPTPPADGEAEELAQWLEAQELAFHREDDFAYASRCLRAAALLRQLPPEGLVFEVCWHPASGARIIRDVVVHSGESGECWTVRNHRRVNPCTEFPTLAAAWEALQQARRQEVGG